MPKSPVSLSMSANLDCVEEGSLSRFCEKFEAPPTIANIISICLVDISSLGADAENLFYNALSKNKNIGLCPAGLNDSGALESRAFVEKAVELVRKHKHVALFGAAKTKAAQGKSVFKIDDLIKSAIKTIANDESTSSRIFTIPYNSKNIDESEIRNIIDYISNIRRESNVLAHKISLNGWSIKPDFSNFSLEVRKASKDKAQELVNIAFQAVWDNVHHRLDATMQSALDKVEVSKKEQICTLLAKGFLEGSTRDRPWDIDKVSEEARKRILSALLREIVPCYSALGDIAPDQYIEDEVQPRLEYFSLPFNCLSQVSPTAYKARYGK